MLNRSTQGDHRQPLDLVGDRRHRRCCTTRRWHSGAAYGRQYRSILQPRAAHATPGQHRHSTSQRRPAAAAARNGATARHARSSPTGLSTATPDTKACATGGYAVIPLERNRLRGGWTYLSAAKDCRLSELSVWVSHSRDHHAARFS